MKTAETMQSELIAKASEDDAFRDRLLSNPRSTIAEEFNLSIPPELSIEVHEETSTTAHLVLPPRSKLGADDLRRVSAGVDPYPP